MREIRGRWRNSSPMISCHSASTSVAFVKKRCPARANRSPSGSTTVLARPPTCSSASTTTTGRPRLASRYPAVSPAGPPPRTSTGCSGVMSGVCDARSKRGVMVMSCGRVGLPVVPADEEQALQRVGSKKPEVLGDDSGQAETRIRPEDALVLHRAGDDARRPGAAPALRLEGDRLDEQQPLPRLHAGDERQELLVDAG